MRIVIRNFFVIVCASGLVTACTVTTNIPKPNELYKVTSIAPPVSEVSIPVSFSKANLLAEINSRINGVIYEDMDLSDDNLQVRVWKTQPMTMEFSGTTILYSIPIKVWVNGSIGILGFSVSSTMEAEMSMAFTTSFSLSKDWKFTPKTTLTGYKWIKEPVANLGSMKLPVNFLADKAIKECKGGICSSIDKNITEGFNLTAVVNQITNAAHRPMLINSEQNLWLVLIPQKISVSPFTSTDTTVTTTIGLKTISEVVVGKKMPELWLDIPMPELSLGNGTGKYLSVNFGIDVPYNEAEILFSKEIVGKTFSKGRRSVRVDSIRIYGSGEKIVIGAQLSGSVKGWIYFKGIASYNASNRTVEFLNLDYELQTKNILHRSASWLFRSTIMNSLKESMVFPIGNELDNMLLAANRNLVQNRSIKNLELNGTISTLAIEKIQLVPDAFRVMVTAKGEISIMVTKLN
ncbi:DUF4403 family protein [Williamwhitmania taraxaci]|uniref:DUF4403 family protein n=1 Tax=Williamwhitmania taraxaci TaxID=1640674 RepID=A0A1G6HHG0_9BACT|nr:DUF4403 family protein [Williamwhitmania taraxaci]SDB93689.1 protein of unknown function [Williamwhitmania taraxaci]